MSFEDRLVQKQYIDQQRRVNEEQAAVFQGFATDDAKNPLWAIIAPIQAEFAKAAYNGQHADHLVELKADLPGKAVAAIWSRWLDNEPYPFLSVQATPRPVPVLHQIVDSSVLDEILAMCEDINSYNTTVSAVLIRMAFTAFKELLVTSFDADPDANTYMIQAYTKDREFLMDIQIHYEVIHRALVV